MKAKDLIVAIVLIVSFIVGLLAMIVIPIIIKANPNDDLWCEKAREIWETKGLTEQTVEELMITSTARQLDCISSHFHGLTTAVVAPLWGLGSIIAGTMIAFVIELHFRGRGEEEDD